MNYAPLCDIPDALLVSWEISLKETGHLQCFGTPQHLEFQQVVYQDVNRQGVSISNLPVYGMSRYSRQFHKRCVHVAEIKGHPDGFLVHPNTHPQALAYVADVHTANPYRCKLFSRLDDLSYHCYPFPLLCWARHNPRECDLNSAHRECLTTRRAENIVS